jgi:hypothetical protein
MNDRYSADEISDYIRKVDWFRTTEAERRAFSQSFFYLENAAVVNVQAESVCRGRMSSLVITLLAVLISSFFGLEPVALLMVTLGVQSTLFLLSQFLESKSKKIVKGCEEAALENVKSLHRRYPLKSEDV